MRKSHFIIRLYSGESGYNYAFFAKHQNEIHQSLCHISAYTYGDKKLSIKAIMVFLDISSA